MVPTYMYVVVQHWILAIDCDRIAVGLLLSHHPCIKKYGSTSYLGMGQVQIGCLYIRYRSSSQKNKAEECRNCTDYPLLF